LRENKDTFASLNFHIHAKLNITKIFHIKMQNKTPAFLTLYDIDTDVY